MFKFLDKELFLFFLGISIAFLFSFFYFHSQAGSHKNESEFNLFHFSIQQIDSEKNYYSVLGFPETKEFQSNQIQFLKLFRIKHIVNIFLSLILFLQLRVFYKLKKINILTFGFLNFVVLIFSCILFLQNEKILYLLSDRNIGTTESVIESLAFINKLNIISHSLCITFVAIPLWLNPKTYFYNMGAIFFVSSSFLILSSLYRPELLEYSYILLNLGISFLVIENYFLWKST